MNLNKHIIDQRIRKLIGDQSEWFRETSDQKRHISKAFLILGISAYLGMELEESYNFVTEGGDDAGIDALYVGDLNDFEFPVIIFQSKYTSDLDKDANFPANAILRVVNSVSGIFDPSKELQLHPELRASVEEIRSLIADGYIPDVKCIMLNNGLTWNNEGTLHIENAKFPPDQVQFEHFNHDDMIALFQSKKEIKDSIKMSGKSIVEDFNYKRILLGKVNVAELARLFNQYGDKLLENNIRKYLGLNTNRVNQDIRTTLRSNKKENFYFYNNGITMVCRKFVYNALQKEDWEVRVEDLQVINGGQTCKTILHTLNDHADDYSQVYVLLRLYELGEGHDELVTDVTIATNSQNPVDLRDLRANDPIQKQLEIAVNELGYIYKRKREGSATGEYIPSSVAAEAVFTIWREKPHLAKFKRNELFGKYYREIFHDLNASQLIIAVLIYRYCDSQRKKSMFVQQHPHLPYSHYFLSMLIGQELLNSMNTLHKPSQRNFALRDVSHRNFELCKHFFETEKEQLYQKANEQLTDALNKLYSGTYKTIELRRLAATFRRGDLLQFLENETQA